MTQWSIYPMVTAVEELMIQMQQNSEYAALITMLLPDERSMVDIKANGFFHVSHRSSFKDIIDELSEGKTATVLLSLRMSFSDADIKHIKYISRVFTGVRLLAFRADNGPINDDTMLELGNCGVKRVVNLQRNDHCFALRNMMVKASDEHIRAKALRQISEDLSGAPADCQKFFALLFEHNSQMINVKKLCKMFNNITASTLNTRFSRAGLPSPKDYLVYSRLIRAASALEPRGVLAGKVAIRLNYSSTQMFHRHLKQVMGMGSHDFRAQYSGDTMLEYFRQRLILPYKSILLDFNPLFPERKRRKSEKFENSG